MKIIIEFLKAHYAEIIDAAISIFGFIAFYFGVRAERKGKKSCAVTEILNQIPEMVSQIESVFPVGFGNVKLGFVLRWIEKLCNAKSVAFDKEYFTAFVNSILEAPTSSKNLKGGDADAEKEDR